MNSVYAHMTSVNSAKGNLGDKMGFIIADWLIGPDNYQRLGIRQLDKVSEKTVALVGSLLAALAETKATIVGGGLINSNKRNYSDDLNVVGVRGFLTKSLLIRDAGISPSVIGDPGLLLSKIYTMPEQNKEKKLGFIVHHVDRDEFSLRYPGWVSHIIDNYEDPKIFLKKLSEYEAVASTSLHGCVFCHSYGVPVAPFVLTDNVIGGDFKFQDYYSSYGIDIKSRNYFSSDEKVVLNIINTTPQPTLDQISDIQKTQLSCIKKIFGSLLESNHFIKKYQNINNNQSKQLNILLITETIFCDNEKNPDVLALYFERFLLTIRSYSQASHHDFDHVFVIYISTDKNMYKEKIERLLQSQEFDNIKGFHFKVVVYEHPSEGYLVNALAHVDKIINPNKGPILRDRLFKSVKFDFNLDNYNLIVRSAIDDDDAIPHWHLTNIAQIAVKSIKTWSESVIGIGLVNSYVAYSQESGTEVELVTLKRAINGNKFYVFKDIKKLYEFSPWSIPDQIDDEVQENILKTSGVRLSLVNNQIPGFFYIRRGKNLSNYRKDGFVEKLISKEDIKNITDIFDIKKLNKIDSSVDNFFVPKAGLKVKALIDNNEIKFNSNFERISKNGDGIAFYLYRDGLKYLQIPYGKKATGQFILSDPNSTYRIKAFLKRGDKIVETYSTSKIKHE